MIGDKTKIQDRSTFLKLGLIFLIFALIGLIACFATPWYTTEVEGDSEDYFYGDFDDDFEEDMKSDEFDDIYHASADKAIIGFGLILFIGILFILDYWKGSISEFVSNKLFRISPQNNPTAAKSAFIVLMMLIMIIPIILSIYGGAKFIGLAVTNQASIDAMQISYVDEEIDIGFGSTAGYISVGIGFIIFLFCFILIIKELPRIIIQSDSQSPKYKNARKLEKVALFIIFLSIIGLMLVPVFSFMKIETVDEYIYFDYDPETDSEIEEARREYYLDYYNEGLIQVYGETSAGSTYDDIFEDLDRDINIITWSLIFIIIFTLISILGIIFYRVGRFPKGAHWLMASGCMIILCCILLFAGYILVSSDVKALGKEQDKVYADLYDYLPEEWIFEKNVIMGSNYGPLGVSVVILMAGIYYSINIWSISSTTLLGEKRSKAFSKRMADRKTRKAVIATIITVILIIAIIGVYFVYFAGEKDKGGPELTVSTSIDYNELSTDSATYSMGSYTSENSEDEYLWELENTQFVNMVSLTLEWNDEPDQTRRHENQPDSFQVGLLSPDGATFVSDMMYNDAGSKYGIVEINTGTIDPPAGWDIREEEDFQNTWRIIIICGDCGDHEASGPAVLKFTDNGNNWYLTNDYSFYFIH
ncbi:MAG: hypothetical protein JSV49_08135 [Thermoplasmata archaeon]|nr:MAG: hypothetical protein JSV49_08135 [Thermoplasmata archaeon]